MQLERASARAVGSWADGAPNPCCAVPAAVARLLLARALPNALEVKWHGTAYDLCEEEEEEEAS